MTFVVASAFDGIVTARVGVFPGLSSRVSSDILSACLLMKAERKRGGGGTGRSGRTDRKSGSSEGWRGVVGVCGDGCLSVSRENLLAWSSLEPSAPCFVEVSECVCEPFHPFGHMCVCVWEGGRGYLRVGLHFCVVCVWCVCVCMGGGGSRAAQPET